MTEDERTSPEGATPGAEPEESTPEPESVEEPAGAPEADASPEAGPAAGAQTEPEDLPSSEPPESIPEPSQQERRARARREQPETAAPAEVVPGADLEPDLVLDEPSSPAERYSEEGAAYAEPPGYAEEEAEPPSAVEEVAPSAGEAPAPRTPMQLAADARYQATGKRKTSVARVILKPGDGSYTVNGRSLEAFFTRPTLQKTARQPLSTAGYESRMDVVAKLHGGGVSAQAGALRHGVARALVEADPNLRGELKRRGFLTRDPRVKERKKAGLKKARKRPQFSKR